MGKKTNCYSPWTPACVLLVLLAGIPAISAAACPLSLVPGNNCKDANGNSISCQGTPGDDSIICDTAPCNIDGGDGNDTVICNLSPCRINGGKGDDSIQIAPALPNAAATNEICGGDGADTITGADGADTLSGEAGNDTLDGAAGVDVLDGGSGDDTVTGGAGQDTIADAGGADTVDGGADGAACNQVVGGDDSLKNCN